MQWNTWNDRRQGDRRSDATAIGGIRDGERREGDRRQFVRLAYPPTTAPKILNANFRVADISQRGIKLVCRDNCEQCTSPITIKSIVDLKIQFHDGETIDIKVEILKCERSLDGHNKTYAGFFVNGISAERMAKEQACPLRHFPDFCRVAYQTDVQERLFQSGSFNGSQRN